MREHGPPIPAAAQVVVGPRAPCWSQWAGVSPRERARCCPPPRVSMVRLCWNSLFCGGDLFLMARLGWPLRQDCRDGRLLRSDHLGLLWPRFCPVAQTFLGFVFLFSCPCGWTCPRLNASLLVMRGASGKSLDRLWGRMGAPLAKQLSCQESLITHSWRPTESSPSSFNIHVDQWRTKAMFFFARQCKPQETP